MTKRQNKIQWRGDNVRALRQHLGLTQEEMAAELGIRQQTVSEWEREIYNPRGPSATLLSMVAERTGFKYKVDSQDEAQESEGPP